VGGVLPLGLLERHVKGNNMKNGNGSKRGVSRMLALRIYFYTALIVFGVAARTWAAGTEVGSFTAPLLVSLGGTHLTTTPANGQLLMGNGTDYTLATVTGTANQIVVTNGAGSITLTTPQSIGTGSTPTFAGLTDSGLTANSFTYSGTSSLLTSTSAPTNGQLLVGLHWVRSGGCDAHGGGWRLGDQRGGHDHDRRDGRRHQGRDREDDQLLGPHG